MVVRDVAEARTTLRPLLVRSVSERVADTLLPEDARRTVRVRARGPARTRTSAVDRTEVAGDVAADPLASVVTADAAASVAAAWSALALIFTARLTELVLDAGAALQVFPPSCGTRDAASATAALTSPIRFAVPKGSAARAVPGIRRPPQTIAMMTIPRPRDAAPRRAANERDSLVRMLRSGSGRKVSPG
jgi:hypothetical protein